MPAPAFRRQPDRRQPEPAAAAAWFAGIAGQAILASEADTLRQAAQDRPGQAGLWLSPSGMGEAEVDLPLLRLRAAARGFQGDVRCGLPLPLPSDSCGVVVVQHLADISAEPAVLLEECTRVLVPGGRRGGSLLPLLFFLAVAMLYPFAVGPDAPLLARTGGGVIWVAALLAAILPLDRLVAPDLERGFFDQWALRGVAEEAIVAVRVIAHWLSFGPPLMIATLPAAALLGIDASALRTVELGLLAGTPGLAAIGVLIAALTASLSALSPALSIGRMRVAEGLRRIG